jgi:hypothetical protein
MNEALARTTCRNGRGEGGCRVWGKEETWGGGGGLLA